VEIMKYLVKYERANDGGWCAYSPDLPGVGIGADTREEARASIEKAIKMRLDGMREDGLPIPQPSLCEFIKYLVIYERAPKNWCAFVPDLPGVGITAKTREAARISIEKAIKMHLDGMREDGLPIPPQSETEYVEVD
jgi:predicted RNase H-like HicB family nuclease